MRSLCKTCSRLRSALRAQHPSCGAASPTALAPSRHALHTSSSATSESRKIRDLLAKFQDPDSPYYIPPGSSGPAHENDHSTSRNTPFSALAAGPKGAAPKIQWRDPEEPVPVEDQVGEGLKSVQFRPSFERLEAGRQGAEAHFAENGYDPKGVLEWSVAWGDCDMFQHANNVNYVRWLESARLRWAETLVDDLPTEAVMNMMHGKGMGFILKDISVRYRHPLTYPDTMLIAVRPHSINPSRASFGMAHALWSLKDNKLAATADSTIVMYDYDLKKKGVLSEEFMEVLERRSGVQRISA